MFVLLWGCSQIAGALIVIAGVCLAAFPGNEGASVFSEVS